MSRKSMKALIGPLQTVRKMAAEKRQIRAELSNVEGNATGCKPEVCMVGLTIQMLEKKGYNSLEIESLFDYGVSIHGKIEKKSTAKGKKK